MSKRWGDVDGSVAPVAGKCCRGCPAYMSVSSGCPGRQGGVRDLEFGLVEDRTRGRRARRQPRAQRREAMRTNLAMSQTRARPHLLARCPRSRRTGRLRAPPPRGHARTLRRAPVSSPHFSKGLCKQAVGQPWGRFLEGKDGEGPVSGVAVGSGSGQGRGKGCVGELSLILEGSGPGRVG